MDEPDNRYLKITLDDAIIKATDEQGERLRLAVKVAGRDVLIRFPTYWNWDFYYEDCYKLFLMLSRYAGDVQLNMELIPQEYFPQWAFIVSQVMAIKQPRLLVDKIFFQYLRPEVEGLEIPEKYKNEPKIMQEYVEDWLRQHMETTHLFYMFQSILLIDHWFKKKSIEILEKIFPKQIQPSSKDTSEGNIMSPPTKLEPGPACEFD